MLGNRLAQSNKRPHDLGTGLEIDAESQDLSQAAIDLDLGKLSSVA
jgi:hypothetical protein